MAPVPAGEAEILLEIVAQLARELRGGQPRLVDLDSSLERDLGLGSLERVELARRVEQRFDVSLPVEAVASAQTPRDLLAAVRIRAATPATPSPAPRETAPLQPGARARAPERTSTLVEVLEWHAAAHGDLVHLRVLGEDDGAHEDVTYAALLERARALAAGLHARGARPGETIGLMFPTSRAYFEAFCAVLLAGAIPVPLYPPTRAARAAEHLRRQAGILSSARAGLLLAAPEVRRAGRAVATPTLRAVVTLDELAELGAERAGPLAILPRADDVALVQYTSGSTGDPKGVVLSHANLLANVRAMAEAIEASTDDVFVSWLPLYHDMGLIGAWMGSLVYGLPLVVMSPLAFLTRPARWLRAIHEHRGTLSPSPNFGYELCVSKIADAELEGLDLSSWRMALDGAEPISARTLRDFTRRFARYGFRESALAPVYGLAECAVGLAFPPPGRGPLVDRVQRDALAREGRAVPAAPGDPTAMEIVACGRALPRHAIRIVDESGHELGEREVGRLEFRGPSTTRGYLHNPEATRRLFDGPWLDSGDLAYVAAGDVYLTGRVKDLVIRAGRNLHPHEIEEAVTLVPGVRRGGVAVFGSIDPGTGGERLIVVAETRETDAAERDRLRARIAAAVADRVDVPPDEVVLAPPRAVPKTSSGKIRRAATRTAWERGVLGREERPWRARASLLALAMRGSAASASRALREALSLARATWSWLAFFAVVTLGWLPIALLPGAERRARLARSAARGLARLTGVRIELEGAEHLAGRGACVLVSNHASYVDSVVLLAAMPKETRYAFVAKGELAERAITRVPLSRLGVVMVRRGDFAHSVEDARRLAEVVRAGRSLLVFPEATLEPSSGVLPFRMGAFVAATEAGVPIVPIAIRGTRSILTPDRWRPRGGVVRVSIGAPLAPGSASFEEAVALRDRTRAWIVRHTGEPDLAGAWEPALDAARASGRRPAPTP